MQQQEEEEQQQAAHARQDNGDGGESPVLCDAGSECSGNNHDDDNGDRRSSGPVAEECCSEECLLCRVDCRPEAYGITPSATQSLRQLMLIEASNFGMIPDDLLFCKVAEAYRVLIYDPAHDRGEADVPLWTPADVKHHFTKCLTLLPRRNVVSTMKSLTRIEKHIRLNELFQTDTDSGRREICPKSLDSYLKVVKTRMDMQKTLMGINKLDAGHIEASRLGVATAGGAGGGGGGGTAGEGAGDAMVDIDMTGESMFA
ncbi:MAG: hypothetical protein CMH41_00845 [Micrococcales bacterium]|nr:hypothetical protein [Micrococcales bacterium]